MRTQYYNANTGIIFALFIIKTSPSSPSASSGFLVYVPSFLPTLSTRKYTHVASSEERRLGFVGSCFGFRRRRRVHHSSLVRFLSRSVVQSTRYGYKSYRVAAHVYDGLHVEAKTKTHQTIKPNYNNSPGLLIFVFVQLYPTSRGVTRLDSPSGSRALSCSVTSAALYKGRRLTTLTPRSEAASTRPSFWSLTAPTRGRSVHGSYTHHMYVVYWYTTNV